MQCSVHPIYSTKSLSYSSLTLLHSRQGCCCKEEEGEEEEGEEEEEEGGGW